MAFSPFPGAAAPELPFASEVPIDLAMPPAAELPPLFPAAEETPALPPAVDLQEPAFAIEPPPPPELLPLPGREPPKAPEPTLIQTAAQTIETAGQQTQAAQAELDRIDGELAQIRADYQATADPTERATLEGRAAQLGQERQQFLGQRDQGRQAASRAADEATVALDKRRFELERKSLEQRDRELAEAERKAEADRQASEKRLRAAEDRVTADLTAYRQALENRETGADWQGVTELVSEALMAGLDRRPPQFGAIIDRAVNRSRGAIQQRAELAARTLGLSRDTLEGEQTIRREIDLQEKAAAVAISEAAIQRVDEQLAREADPLRQAQLATQRDALVQQREARAAAAVAAQEEADRKRELEFAKQRKLQLEAEKTAAETRKIEAETAKLRGTSARGRPRADVLAPADLRARGLSRSEISEVNKRGVRWQGKFLFNPDGSAVLGRDVATAKDGQAKINGALEVSERVNRIMALRNEYGISNWASLSDERKKRLKTLGADLVSAYNVARDLGALDNSTIEMVEKIVGDAAGLYDNTSKLREFQSLVERDLNGTLTNNFGYAGPSLRLPTIEAAPRVSADTLLTRISQPPGPGRGRSVEKRKTDVDVYHDTLRADRSMSLREADEEFVRSISDARDRVRADTDVLRDELDAAMPPDWRERNLRVAGSTLWAKFKIDSDPDATGAEKREAERAHKRALQEAENALSPEAKRLRDKYKAQLEYLDYLEEKIEQASGRVAESERLKLERERAQQAANEAAVQQFEVGQAPAGARGF